MAVNIFNTKHTRRVLLERYYRRVKAEHNDRSNNLSAFSAITI